MRRIKMMSVLTAVGLVAVALAASASPAGAVTPDTKTPQEYYKKIQHQWLLDQKALANGNMKAVKMQRRQGHALTEQYRQRVRLDEGPRVLRCRRSSRRGSHWTPQLCSWTRRCLTSE
jgi:hypothetical protein